jgi:glycerol-3-phosphate O-acyltransferase
MSTADTVQLAQAALIHQQERARLPARTANDQAPQALRTWLNNPAITVSLDIKLVPHSVFSKLMVFREDA